MDHRFPEEESERNLRLVRIIRLLVRVIVVLAAAVLITFIVLLCVRGCQASPDTPADPAGQTEDASGAPSDPQDPSADDGVTLPATADAGTSYQDRLTFVGDSLTAHLVRSGKLTGGKLTKQVWHTENNMLNLNSDVTNAKIILPATGESMTIAAAAGAAKPEYLIVTLGTDWGVSYLTEADFKACYTKLIDEIREASPSTVIILQSIFPVTKSCKVLSNEKIDRANGWVRAVAAATGCRYLDTQSVLKDKDNCLKKEYCGSNDGIHLTDDAYAVILGYIRTHAYTK